MPHFARLIILLFCVFGNVLFGQNNNNRFEKSILNQIDFHIVEADNFINNFNYFNAKKEIDQALHLAESINSKQKISVILAKKGQLSYVLGNYNEALDTLNKAINIQEPLNDLLNLAESYKTYGDVLMVLKMYGDAFKSFQNSETIFNSQNLPNKEALVLLAQGKAQFYMQHLEESKNILNHALNLSVATKSQHTESEVLINLAKVYSALNQNKKALSYIHSGINIAKKNSFLDILSEAYLISSNIYNNIKDYHASRDYLNLHLKVNNSLADLNRTKSIKNQEFQFKLNEANKKIIETNNKLIKIETEKKLGIIITLLSFAVIVILILLTYMLYKNNIAKFKNNNLLQSKNEELVIAKEKAEQATKDKTAFLSKVTHELRTPLFAVTGLSNILLEENPKPEQIQYLKSLKFSGQHLLAFINDILQINKLESRKEFLMKQRFNLNQRILEIMQSLQHFAEDNKVSIHLNYDPRLSKIFNSDAQKISQILINLIGNAIKFSKEGDIWVRVIKIAEQDNETLVRFEVEDNGIGISTEKQDAIFESFSQVNMQINPKYDGTGLGLSIVKSLIEILKGEIKFKSELNKGTIFYFEIPMETASEAEEILNEVSYFKENLKAIDVYKILILLVEDNKVNQIIIKKILTNLNLNCDVVDTAEVAIEHIESKNYNLVLMDINLPGMNGIMATEHIRTFNKTLPIIALTAVTIEDQIDTFNTAGFNDIVPKPFNKIMLENIIYKHLS